MQNVIPFFLSFPFSNLITAIGLNSRDYIYTKLERKEKQGHLLLKALWWWDGEKEEEKEEDGGNVHDSDSYIRGCLYPLPRVIPDKLGYERRQVKEAKGRQCLSSSSVGFPLFQRVLCLFCLFSCVNTSVWTWEGCVNNCHLLFVSAPFRRFSASKIWKKFQGHVVFVILCASVNWNPVTLHPFTPNTIYGSLVRLENGIPYPCSVIKMLRTSWNNLGL